MFKNKDLTEKIKIILMSIIIFICLMSSKLLFYSIISIHPSTDIYQGELVEIKERMTCGIRRGGRNRCDTSYLGVYKYEVNGESKKVKEFSWVKYKSLISEKTNVYYNNSVHLGMTETTKLDCLSSAAIITIIITLSLGWLMYIKLQK